MDLKKIELNYDYILVDEDSVVSTEKSNMNIVLPENRESIFPESGIVLKVGPGRYDKRTESFIVNPFKVGQHVMFNQRAGQVFNIDGRKYRLLRDQDILAIVKK